MARFRARFAPQPASEAPDEPDLVAFETPFAVSDALLSQLRAARVSAGREPDIIEQRLSAFVLDPGLGPPVYLSVDGRVVWDGWYEWTKNAPTERDAYASLIVGAKKTGVAALLDLLPRRPDDADDCLACAGTGWSDLLSASGEPFQVICGVCRGLGWNEDGDLPGPKTMELLTVLARISALLRDAGERHLATWVDTAAARIRSGDAPGLDTVLDAYGGMGSFNDLVLCEANGHDVARARPAAMNAELDELRTAAWTLAREVRRVAEIG